MKQLVLAMGVWCVAAGGCGDGSDSDDTTALDAASPDANADAGGMDAGGLDAGSPDAGQACSYPPAARGFTFVMGTDGPTTYYAYAPAQPRGLIIALHGTNGAAEALAVKKVEWASFERDAVARHYALLIPESDQRTSPRQWDNSTMTGNPDTARLARLIDLMISRQAITATTPIYVLGMSQGGGVAGIFAGVLAAAGRPVHAVAPYAAGGSATYRSPQYTLPTTFALLINDTVAETPAMVQTNVQNLQSRGIATQFFVQPEGKLCAERFTRIPGISASDSMQITAGLIAADSVEADGTVNVASSDADTGSNVPGIPAAYAMYAAEISEQLRVVAAQHTFYGDRNAATLDFFDQH